MPQQITVEDVPEATPEVKVDDVVIDVKSTKNAADVLGMAQTLGGRFAHQVAAARNNLDEALTSSPKYSGSIGSSSSSTPAVQADPAISKAIKGLQDLGQRMAPFWRQLKFAPLSAMEFFGSPANEWEDQNKAAEAKANTCFHLAQQLWDCWLRKHAALTLAESLYSSLLADSRRIGVLTAELKVIEELSKPTEAELADPEAEASAIQALKQEALYMCTKDIEAYAQEAVSAFEERTRHYPCGQTSAETGYLTIARTEDQVGQVVKAFKARVAEECTEALSQVRELVLAPSFEVLTASLERRVAFWEAEIEENWAQWSRHSGLYHESCQAAAEVWAQLRHEVAVLRSWIDVEARSTPQRNTGPVVFLLPVIDPEAVRQARLWEGVNDALVEVATVTALLGAWTEFHHLRGDGEVLSEAQELLESVMTTLDTCFDLRFAGSEAVKSALAAHPMWQHVQAAAEASAKERGLSEPWWLSTSSPARVAEPAVEGAQMPNTL